MSYQSWHEYGYGICTDNLEISSVERMETLLNHAPTFREKIHSWLSQRGIENPTVEDYCEFDEDYQLGIATILKEVISEAEGILLTPCDDYNSSQFLLYSRTYPWFLREHEKNLTASDIAQIIIKYVQIISDSEVAVDYHAVENGG